MAEQDREWRYRRIFGALSNLGYQIALSHFGLRFPHLYAIDRQAKIVCVHGLSTAHADAVSPAGGVIRNSSISNIRTQN